MVIENYYNLLQVTMTKKVPVNNLKFCYYYYGLYDGRRIIILFSTKLKYYNTKYNVNTV